MILRCKHLKPYNIALQSELLDDFIEKCEKKSSDFSFIDLYKKDLDLILIESASDVELNKIKTDKVKIFEFFKEVVDKYCKKKGENGKYNSMKQNLAEITNSNFDQSIENLFKTISSHGSGSDYKIKDLNEMKFSFFRNITSMEIFLDLLDKKDPNMKTLITNKINTIFNKNIEKTNIINTDQNTNQNSVKNIVNRICKLDKAQMLKPVINNKSL